MISIVEEKCTLCLKCTKICPHNAIVVDEGHVRIIADRCTHCALCVNSCRYGAIVNAPDDRDGRQGKGMDYGILGPVIEWWQNRKKHK